MQHPDPQAGRICQALELGLPHADAVAVGATAIGGDRHRLRVGVAVFAELLPQARMLATAFTSPTEHAGAPEKGGRGLVARRVS